MKPLRILQQWLTANQRGGFSPFMYGMLVGISILSTVAAYQAKIDIKKQTERKLEQQQREAEDLSLALENSILTETDATYDSNVSLARARNFTTLTTGKTRGGQDAEFNVITTDGAGEQFGVDNQTVVLTTTDDTMLEAGVAAQTTRAGALNYSGNQGEQPLATFDASGARNRQIQLSRENLEMEASQVYLFYSANLACPTTGEYATINTRTGYKDYWGNDFTYTRFDDNHCSLSYTTPWGFTDLIDMVL